MGERSDAIRLAAKLLHEPGADPDDNLRVLSRQLLRHAEAVAALKKELAARDDPAGDLIAANRDALLDMHQEAVRRVRKVLEGNRPARRDLALEVLDALGKFHPMHGESWPGWPEGS